MGSRIKLIVIPVIVVIIVAVALYLYFSVKKSPGAPPPAAPQTADGPETLGGKIYEGASNPIQDKVPTVNPVTNPVEGLYKNPFE